LKWYLFLNMLITNWKIPPMFNSLFIYENIIKTNHHIKQHIKILDIEN
jgi:hypothetical protein